MLARSTRVARLLVVLAATVGRTSASDAPGVGRAGRAAGVQRPPRGAPDFGLQLRQQAETDRRWREASVGAMRMDKITYRSRAGDLDIPAFVFQPLDEARGGQPPGAGLGARERPRSSVRALHPVCQGGHGAGDLWSSRPSTAAASGTAVRSTTPSTTAAPKWTTW